MDIHPLKSSRNGAFLLAGGKGRGLLEQEEQEQRA